MRNNITAMLGGLLLAGVTFAPVPAFAADAAVTR